MDLFKTTKQQKKNGSGQEWAGFSWILWTKALKAILTVLFARNESGFYSLQESKMKVLDYTNDLIS